MTESPPDAISADARARVLAAAAELVARGGAAAATTRAVAAAAGVQAPTIYRLFGDKRGLLDAVAEAALAAYVHSKAARTADRHPVADLRRSWDAHVAFCLANPAIFALMSDGRAGSSPAAEAGLEVLRGRVRRVARLGLLRVSEERAVDLIHAAGTGAVLVLLGKPEDMRDDLAAAAREAVLAAVLAAPPAGGGTETHPAPLASTLRSRLSELRGLTPGERLLLDELLARIADVRPPP